jgi:cytoplasmic iron level regulating protein YaaA (DUF328/UPF0246 family)
MPTKITKNNILKYRKTWIQHVDRLQNNRLPTLLQFKNHMDQEPRKAIKEITEQMSPEESTSKLTP